MYIPQHENKHVFTTKAFYINILNRLKTKPTKEPKKNPITTEAKRKNTQIKHVSIAMFFGYSRPNGVEEVVLGVVDPTATGSRGQGSRFSSAKQHQGLW